MINILLVEDNEMNKDMLSRRLSRRGFNVLTADNGQEAIDRAKASIPDIILMDMDLPVKDGWTASQELKSNPSTLSIPIIALTAHAMSGDRQKALSFGCNDYETKPIEFQRLLAKISELTA